MQDFSVEVTQFAKDDVKVKIMTKIPVSGWSYDEGKRCLVENDDPTAFGAGAIQFKVRENVEKFDFYKDDFENYQDIGRPCDRRYHVPRPHLQKHRL